VTHGTRRRAALTEPTLASAGPEDIVRHPGLTREEKIEVLRSMEYDAAELAVAEEEGMRGPENDQLRRILLALAELTRSSDADSVAPSKQHGLH
jgi:hypothetical protein